MCRSNPVRVTVACITTLVSVLFAPIAARQQPEQAPNPLVKENATVKVSPHVYVIPDGNVGAVPNVGIIVGTDATLVIDTGLGRRNGETVLREMRKVSETLQVFIASTHYHPEHTLGESAFPVSAQVIRAQAQQEDIEELGDASLKGFAGRTPFMGELLKGAQYRKGDIFFDREKVLDLGGGVRVRMLALGPTHTRGDTAFFVEGDRVLFAGDIVMNRAFLAFGAQSSARAWLASLDQLEALVPRHIVPSHGEMGDSALIVRNRAVLKALESRVRELKAQGKSAEETAQALTAEFQTKYPDWRGPNRIGAAARSFYAELP